MKACIGFAALAVVGVTGCSDRGHAAPATAELVVSPGTLDFGRVRLHGRSKLTVSLSNAGRAQLGIAKAWVDRASPFDPSFAEAAPHRLENGEMTPLDVTFAPDAEGATGATLLVQTEVPSDPVYRIILKGEGVAAAVSLETAELDFGRVEVESAEALAIRVRNVSPLPVTVSPSLIGADAAEFDAPGSLEVAAGTAADLPIHFRPLRVGTKEVALAVSPCPGCADDVVMVRAEGLAQAVVAEPGQLTFGDVPVARRITLSARLHNVSTQPMTVTGMDLVKPADLSFQTEQTAFPVLLQPNEAREYPVTFVVTHMGAATAMLDFAVASKHNPQTHVALQGNGGAAELCVFPNSYDFGSQPVGSNTATTVTLRNCGTSTAPPLIIQEAAFPPNISGEDSAFTSPVQAWPVSLASGQELQVKVFYAPNQAGTSSANFIVRSSGFKADTVVVPFVGTAVDHAPCMVAVTPGAVDFGTVPPGTGAVLGVKVLNAGNDLCAVKNIQLAQEGGPFSMPGGRIDGLVLWPGDAFSFQVAFVAAPTAKGSYQGAVQLEQSNRRRPKLWVPLSANAQASCLVATPPYLDFGSNRPDCRPSPRSTTLLNQCPTPLTLRNIWIGQGTTDSEFSLTQVPALPKVLNPTDTADVQVTYAAQVLGMNLSPLFIDVPGLDRPQLVPLLGESDLTTTTTDVFTQQGGKELDVLFVVDNTAAMASQQPMLVNAIPQFVSAVQQAGLDLHVAVTTTGTTPVSSGCPGGVLGGEAGRLFPADNSLPRILTQATPNLTKALQDDVSVGLCSITPRGLEAMRLALSPPLVNNPDDPRTPLPNDGNLGFLRPEAALAVLFVSSRDDASPDDVPTYVQFLQSLKGAQQPQRVTAYAVAPTNTPCPSAGGTGTRYDEVATRTGGQTLDICAGDYGPLLAAIPQKAVGPQTTFPLSGTPQTGTLTVAVNGSAASGWTYSALTNSVTFDSPPASGATLQISYTKVCGP